MASINETYRQWLEAHPQNNVAVIIKTTSPPAEHVAALEAHRLTVTQTFRLVPAVAATGQATDVLALLAEPWVISIEPDQPIHTAL